jgi:3-oxoacyl-(acyl-carrier-protein) synthase
LLKKQEKAAAAIGAGHSIPIQLSHTLPETIAITAIASLSPLGNDLQTIWKNYQTDAHFFKMHDFGTRKALAAFLDHDSKGIIENLRQLDPKYKFLDNSVLYAIAASRKAVADAGWKERRSFRDQHRIFTRCDTII